MTPRSLSRREFLGSAALGFAGATVLSNPVRAAADAAGVKPSDLSDLTVKEVKIYVANLGPQLRRINSPETGEIVSIVTNSGIEGNYTIGNRVGNNGWLEYAKSVCLGKNILDIMAGMMGGANERNNPTNGFGRGFGFVGGFGYPRGRRLGTAAEVNYNSAIIDVCLWDILGKAANRPIYKLLGGTKDRMLAYASSLHLATLEEFAPQAQQAKAEGFRCYKIHPGGGQHPSGSPIPAYVGHIEEIKSVRQAVGDEFTLLFDPVQRYNVFEALRVGRVLEEQNYSSFEDPIPSTDIEGLIELRRSLTVPIEVGEFIYGIQGYAEYIRREALDIVRLISDNVGGITGSFRVGQLADAFGMPCTPHNWGNGFDLAVHFQLELALPNCFWFELPYPQTLSDRVYLKEKFRIDKDGYVPASKAPGLGVTLDRDALDKILTRIDR
ncbi:MAG TPA: mandelate racemase/muconate lactonizing enzyme family protein [Opitutaceae bacterium]|nr:mandelate racemase/muconate lactonizing enzyme family protein [Opitutaceae bacterium]